jgi:hypothetical protein
MNALATITDFSNKSHLSCNESKTRFAASYVKLFLKQNVAMKNQTTRDAFGAI